MCRAPAALGRLGALPRQAGRRRHGDLLTFLVFTCSRSAADQFRPHQVHLAWPGRTGIANGLAVAETSPIKSVADLQALSKTRPVKFTSTGPAGHRLQRNADRGQPAWHQPQLITGL